MTDGLRIHAHSASCGKRPRRGNTMARARTTQQSILALTMSKALACGVSVATLCLAAAPAMAQEPAGESAESDEAIVVTGSRLRRDGFETPTPVTVVSAAE